MKALIIALVMLVSVSASAQEQWFGDVPATHPAYWATRDLYLDGVTAGCRDFPLFYCPDDPLTRGDFAIMVDRIAEQARHSAFMDMITFLQAWICSKDDGTLMDCRGGNPQK